VISLLLGLILIIVAVVTWVGGLTLAHAIAILIGAIAIALILWGFGDRTGRYTRL
jgi:hypothetical protein